MIGPGASSTLPDAVVTTSEILDSKGPKSIPWGEAARTLSVIPSGRSPKPSPAQPVRIMRSTNRSATGQSESIPRISSTSLP